MRAIVLEAPNRLALRNIPRFALAADEVMVQIEACGICGSDLRYYRGENPWALHTTGKNLANPPNIVLGHEFVGRVVETAGPLGRELLGERVAVLPWRACGRCDDCRHGRPNLCAHTIHYGHGAGWGKRDYYPGGMAEYCPAWADRCYRLPEDVPAHHAALLDGLGVSVHALGVAGFEPGDAVAVIGCGPIGLGIAAIARAWGATAIYCVDVYPKALEIARQVTAGQIIDGRHEDPVALVCEQSHGRGVSCAFDLVGSAVTQRQGLAMLGHQGTLVNLATKAVDVTWRLTDLGAERSVRSSSNALETDFQVAVEVLVSGQILAEPWITQRVSLDETPATFQLLLDKEASGAFKAVVEPGRG